MKISLKLNKGFDFNWRILFRIKTVNKNQIAIVSEPSILFSLVQKRTFTNKSSKNRCQVPNY